MKRIITFIAAALVGVLSIAQDINLIYNGQPNNSGNIDGWKVVSTGEASADIFLYEDHVTWSNTPKYRLGIDVTAINENPEFTDILVTDSSTFSLTVGDSCYFEYFAFSKQADNQAQFMLISEDAEEGELTQVILETVDMPSYFNGKVTSSAIIPKTGTYQFAFACGADVDTFVINNLILYTYAYQSDGAPLISSFSVQKEEQGEQGVNQIIGRAVVEDLEGDDFDLSFSILSGGGSLTLIDSASFIYTEEGPGEKIFKVIATDSNGNTSSKTTSYTVSDFDTAQLYFNEDVWELVRAENGYSSHASFVFVENDPDLPNVLLMGNSISIGYTPYVRSALEGKANVYRIPDNGGSTLDMFKNQALWLGKTHWDVIHFNWGLHDLKYLLNNQLNINGEQVVPVDEYEVNMDSIVRILTPEADHLIFATTSHIPSAAAGRIAGDEVIYNEAALRVMENYSYVMIDDQYTLTNEYPLHNSESDVHFTNEGKEMQGEQAAAKILEALEGTAALNEVSHESSDLYYDRLADKLILNNTLDLKKISIYNIKGQKLLSAAPSSSLNLSALEKGVYIVTLKTNDNKIISNKIVK